MKTVSQFMDDDHARLDELWQDFFAKKNDPAEALEGLKKFSDYFERHVALEDEILFPRFNKYLGFGAGEGPVAVLTRDHETILKLLTDLKKSAETGGSATMSVISNNFYRLLSKHRERENKMGYPVCDDIITPAEWQELVKSIYGKDYFQDRLTVGYF